MANVVGHDDERPTWVPLGLSKPMDATRPRKDQAHQIPAKITKGGVPGFSGDRHLTVSHLANSFACRAGILDRLPEYFDHRETHFLEPD